MTQYDDKLCLMSAQKLHSSKQKLTKSKTTYNFSFFSCLTGRFYQRLLKTRPGLEAFEDCLGRIFLQAAMLFLLPNQQCQSTEGISENNKKQLKTVIEYVHHTVNPKMSRCATFLLYYHWDTSCTC